MPAQRWDPERYEENARFVSELGLPVVELLAPRAGERVLALGCGDGRLSGALQQRGCRVVGVDASPELVAAARAAGLAARLADAERLDFEEAFDAVFSNAALHWMRDADAVIGGVWRSLVPGGRFVGELGGEGNVARIVTALLAALERRGIDGRALHPWIFPSASDYRSRLERGGFRVDEIRLFARPTRLPGDVGDWLETFAGPFFVGLDPTARAALLDELREALRPSLQGRDGAWIADYVRLRFRARKPGPAGPGAAGGLR